MRALPRRSSKRDSLATGSIDERYPGCEGDIDSRVPSFRTRTRSGAAAIWTTTTSKNARSSAARVLAIAAYAAVG